MQIKQIHKWNLRPKEAIGLQKELAGLLKSIPSPALAISKLKRVAGVDVSYSKSDNRLFASVVILSYPGLEIIEEKVAQGLARFPYVPGLLSFREGPIVLKAFAKIKNTPDVVIFDGQGIAHPRGLGLASHMGLLLGLPTIGCAKSRLIGEYKDPGTKRGSYSALTFKNKLVGSVLRTRDKVKPVFISKGVNIDLPSSRKIVLACCRGYRLPEPTRQAHILVNKLREKALC